jgi:hypothetical protein
MGKVNKIISCDPSEGGRDKTVIMWGGECNGVHKVCLIESEDKSDPMSVADRIVSLYRSKGADYIKVDVPNHPVLKKELMGMKKERSMSEKWKVIDPEEKSPDFSDCLVYFCWKVKSSGGFFVINS